MLLGFFVIFPQGAVEDYQRRMWKIEVNCLFLQVKRRNNMEALQDTMSQTQGHDALIALRQRATLLVSQSESEELLAEAVAILSGRPLPCAYTLCFGMRKRTTKMDVL